MKMLRFLAGSQGKPPKRLMRPATMIPLFSFVLLGLIVLYYFSPFNLLHNAQAASLTVLPGQQPAIVKQSQAVGGVDPNTPVTIAVGLRLRNQSGLTQYVKSVSQAKQRVKRSLTPDQIIRAYAPLPSSEQAVISYMQQYGLRVTSTSSYHTVVGFSGTIGQAENAMHVQVSNYRAASGKAFYAPSSHVNVPATIAPFIQSVTGLDNAVHYTRPPIKGKHTPQLANSASTANSTSCPTADTSGTNAYYLPSQMAGAYNLQGLYSQNFHGEGQTVALMEFSYYNNSDVGTYASCFSSGHVPVAHEIIDNGSGTTDGAIEVSLDVDAIISAAPKLASLRLY
ncbi:MAG TPA: protease pro-enzyme activation domain-containing protein, partial [Ktedonobacteraceae bacterium]|nr:protease pro-enzyme activation domain-containing protein [Ktedonobacteraceae bacterium]